MKQFNKVFLTFFFLGFATTLSAQMIEQGKPWLDTDGVMVNAHGGGILKYNDTYYWYGEFKRSGKRGNMAMDGVSCYSSKDLATWKNEGLALKMIANTNSLLQPGCILERPKVIYNKKTKKFVMWFHHELKGKGYDAALTGLAVSDHPEGPFKYLKSIRPNKGVWPQNFPDSLKNLSFTIPTDRNAEWHKKVIEGILVQRDFNKGQMARDMTLFVDDDGTAYHIHSSEDNQTLHISKLTDDYLDFTDEYWRVKPGGSNEAPALFKYQNKYYLFTSGTTGWAPNPGRSFVADKIYGPYKNIGNPVRGSQEDIKTTFHSQSTYILPVNKGTETKFIFMGDRWMPDNPIDGCYIWLPITFENNIPVIRWEDPFRLMP
ncbi:family 43 glycosylhydrolase [Pedobacter sp. SD-b]|uniref:Family 43 glycosylhydrolase n=1 Tax=Pedobacter segetis TaxID=2793069 RepID=A0ABS1BP84_9SPHI|nr:glycoside hydrolase family 43 protein [Pedobacter segetis]MBK0384069.1 family 43 glycosylhydrolase [Pedobacter segetis]